MTEPTVALDVAAQLFDVLDPSAVAVGGKDKAWALYDEQMQSPAAKKRLAEWLEQDQGDPVLEEARRTLLPSLLIVEQKYLQIARQWPQVFWRTTAEVPDENKDDTPPERWAEMRYTGLAQLRHRGARAVRDSFPGERFVYYLNRADVGLAVPMALDLVEGVSFVSRFATIAMGLAESHFITEEILHANVLNTGSVYNPTIGGDGVPLFWGDHPIDNGKYSNLLTPAAELNERALEVASNQIRVFPDQANNRMFARPRKLLVPIELEFVAERLRGTPAFPVEGYQVLDFLTDQRAWFLTTSIKGLVSVEWKPFRLDLFVEEGRLVLEGSQSYGCGYRNPRGCFASFPKAG